MTCPRHPAARVTAHGCTTCGALARDAAYRARRVAAGLTPQPPMTASQRAVKRANDRRRYWDNPDTVKAVQRDRYHGRMLEAEMAAFEARAGS